MSGNTTEKFVQGEDIVLRIGDKLTLHATKHDLKVDLAVKDVRTKDTNGVKKVAGDLSWGVDVDGLVVVDGDAAKLGAEDILGIILAKEEIDVVLEAPVSGLKKKYTGKGLVTSVSVSTTPGENASYTASITGSEDLTPVNIVPPAK